MSDVSRCPHCGEQYAYPALVGTGPGAAPYVAPSLAREMLDLLREWAKFETGGKQIKRDTIAMLARFPETPT